MSPLRKANANLCPPFVADIKVSCIGIGGEKPYGISYTFTMHYVANYEFGLECQGLLEGIRLDSHKPTTSQAHIKIHGPICFVVESHNLTEQR